jgi:hypothetical protein
MGRAYLHDTSPPEEGLEAQAVGAATVTGLAIDTLGYEGVEFVIHVNGGNRAIDAKVQRDDAAGFASPTDITGAAITQIAGGTAKATKVISVYKPAERYVRISVTGSGGSTNRTVAAIARKYGPSGGAAARYPVAGLCDETVEVGENI